MEGRRSGKGEIFYIYIYIYNNIISTRHTTYQNDIFESFVYFSCNYIPMFLIFHKFTSLIQTTAYHLVMFSSEKCHLWALWAWGGVYDDCRWSPTPSKQDPHPVS